MMNTIYWMNNEKHFSAPSCPGKQPDTNPLKVNTATK